MKTNISSTLTLLRKDCTTVAVTFNESYGQNSKHYVYKVLRADNVQVGDTLVVKVGGEFKLVTVREVHARPKLDAAATFNYKWAVQRVDTTQFDRLRAQEQAFEEMLLDAEQERMVAELRNTIVERFGLDSNAIKMLDKFTNGEK